MNRSFRVFTNDVAPNAFSCLKRVTAVSAARAANDFELLGGQKVFVVLDKPDALELFGPNGQTGRLPAKRILGRGVSAGLCAGPRTVKTRCM